MSSVISSVSNPSISPTDVFYDRVPLKRLVAKTVFYQLAWKKSLQGQSGRSYSWTLGGVQAADPNALAAGVPVVPTPVNTNTLKATVQEYGNAVSISSEAGNTSVVDSTKFLLDQIEQKGAYTIDQIIRNEVYGTCTNFGTNLFAANNKSSISAIGSTDILTLADLRRAHAILENNNTPTYRDGKMAAVISVAQKYDVTNSSAGGGYLDLAKQNPAGISDIKKDMMISEDGEIKPLGDYAGLVLFATSLTPVVNNGTVNVHYAAAWGSESLAAIELDSERFKIFKVDGNEGGTFDILQMIQLSMGYKVDFAAKNLSQDTTTAANQRVVVMASAVSAF